MKNNHNKSHHASPAIIDGVPLDATYAAGAALRAAQAALDHYRTRSYDPAGWDNEESGRVARERITAFDARLQLFEPHIRNSMSDEELELYRADWEPQWQQQELIAHWAAAEANRSTDPALAARWAARVSAAGVDVARARATAAQHRESVWPPTVWTRMEQLAADYVEITALLGKDPWA